MTVALELVCLQGRAPERVYHALAWVCVRAGGDPAKRLAGYARLLHLDDDEARAIEAAARAGRAVRIGRDPLEKVWLRQALQELARAHPALAGVASRLVSQVKAPSMPRPGPFEESDLGPPLVFARA